MRRPTGITLLATLYLVGSALGLAMSCFAVVAGRRLREEDETLDDMPPVPTQEPASPGRLVSWIGLLGAVASLLGIVAGVGLWMLQPWGWRLAVLRATLRLTTHLVAFLQGATISSGLVGVLVNGAVLVYLSRPHVRQALRCIPKDAPATP